MTAAAAGETGPIQILSAPLRPGSFGNLASRFLSIAYRFPSPFFVAATNNFQPVAVDETPCTKQPIPPAAVIAAP